MHLAGQINWGDVPTWAGFVAAAVAAAFAAAGFVKLREQAEEQSTFITEQRALMAEQMATLTLERKELRAVAEDRISSQARQVKMDVQEFDRTMVARVFNKSGWTIRDVAVKFGSHTPMIHEVSRENFSVVLGEYEGSVPMVGPDHVFEFWLQDQPMNVMLESRPVLHFRDSQGAEWQLDEYGDLKPVRQS
ncbi:hypothetical protein [Streptomyces rubellomurinus]|uniref:Uncharacterized protein n=1 Tax=Streptomyces rubellomurinus (strain ATCC 31215) TaxID=359131 RepID=A0A0F2TBT2_STRR3|nr:hypothetical protein [Streptomyces rubellomurinus]KJS60663.1 hypothetical protein VM95_19800 [Streptomyces rubellomurinus]